MKERLTERVANGGVKFSTEEFFNICYPQNEHCLRDIDRMAIKLCELEDKIENGTLIEIPSIRYSERFDAWVLYYMDRDCLQTCIMTKAQAEAKLKELKNEQN